MQLHCGFKWTPQSIVIYASLLSNPDYLDPTCASTTAVTDQRALTIEALAPKSFP